MPQRTRGAITARACLLGLANYARRWTPAEEQRLNKLTTSMFSLDTIAKTLDRGREGIMKRCRQLARELPLTPTRALALGHRLNLTSANSNNSHSTAEPIPRHSCSPPETPRKIEGRAP